MIDLHTHSTASDGSFSPAALLETAAAQGLSALALTDHDTVDGLEEAGKAAEANGVGFIPGVELQINWRQEAASNLNKGEFHLLGLGIVQPSRAFLKTLEELREARKSRNLQIIERMNGLGIEAAYDEIIALSGGKVVGRPHFATFLTNKRLVKDQEQAFSRYLGPGKPLYVPKTGLDFDKAAALIKESGGIAVLAHPISLFVGWKRLPDLLKNLKKRGLDGIEAWHPAAKSSVCMKFETLGKELGLFITAGSDFHGANRPDRRLGFTAGEKEIEDLFLEAVPPLNSRLQGR